MKLCDFGSAKALVRGEPNVSYICSRYYRAPELIFGSTDYSTAIDIWSEGEFVFVIYEVVGGDVGVYIGMMEYILFMLTPHPLFCFVLSQIHSLPTPTQDVSVPNSF